MAVAIFFGGLVFTGLMKLAIDAVSPTRKTRTYDEMTPEEKERVEEIMKAILITWAIVSLVACAVGTLGLLENYNVVHLPINNFTIYLNSVFQTLQVAGLWTISIGGGLFASLSFAALCVNKNRDKVLNDQSSQGEFEDLTSAEELDLVNN